MLCIWGPFGALFRIPENGAGGMYRAQGEDVPLKI